jgi:TRAP-type mannitol/chloroaromatic compound transport system permease small subunit
MQGIADAIDRFTVAVGRISAWLTLIMVVLTSVIVVLRYAFDLGWIWLQESVTWMHAAVFMLAAAYTLARDEHVRVDIFYRDMSPRRQAIVNALGTILFLVPVALFLLWSSWEYVSVSWSIREASQEAGGLVFPLPSMLKSFIPLMSGLLLIQGASILIRSCLVLASGQTAQQTVTAEHRWPG